MNFLFLNSARSWGGNEKWTLMAMETLSEKHRVFLGYRSPELGTKFDFPKFRLPFLFELDLLTLIPLIVILLRHRIDVIIPTKRKDYVLAGIAARLCGRVNILRLGIVRSLSSRPQRLKKWVYHDLNDGLIVNAQRIRTALRKSDYMRNHPVRVIYNGVDTDRLHEMAHDLCKPAPFIMVSMGALIPRKGMDRLLDGFGEFLSRAQQPDCRLVIIGGGESRGQLEAQAARLRLGPRVIITGHLDNPYPWLKAGDLFILASQNEGISNAVLEAMVFRCAVMTTRAGGAGELISHLKNGWLLDNTEAGTLAGAIQRLYEDRPMREALADAGYRTVMKRHSMQAMGEEIAGFCGEILAFRGTGCR